MLMMMMVILGSVVGAPSGDSQFFSGVKSIIQTERWVLRLKKFKVAYRESVTGPRSRGMIVNRHPAINNKLATNPTPNPT